MFIYLIVWAGLIYNYRSTCDLGSGSRSIMTIVPTILLLTALFDHFLLAALGDANLMHSDGSFAATVIAFFLLAIMVICHLFSLAALGASALQFLQGIWRCFSEPSAQFERIATTPLLAILNTAIIYFYYFFRNEIHPMPKFGQDLTVVIEVIQSDFVKLLFYPKALLALLALAVLGWIMSLFDYSS